MPGYPHPARRPAQGSFHTVTQPVRLQQLGLIKRGEVNPSGLTDGLR